jgi:1-deoxy-D-xylulose-5-phosphate synthase
VPGLRSAAPRDAESLREELREAVAVDDGPTILRFPSGSVAASLPALRRVGQVDVLREESQKDVLVVAVGAFAKLGMEAAERIAEQGYGVTVVDPRWVRPVPVELAGLARQYRLVVTLEDGVRAGGVGDAVASMLRDRGVDVPLRDFGVPAGFHPHGTRAEILASLGLTAQDIARSVTECVSRLDYVAPERQTAP